MLVQTGEEREERREEKEREERREKREERGEKRKERSVVLFCYFEVKGTGNCETCRRSSRQRASATLRYS